MVVDPETETSNMAQGHTYWGGSNTSATQYMVLNWGIVTDVK